jgi:hypothetical protein
MEQKNFIPLIASLFLVVLALLSWNITPLFLSIMLILSFVLFIYLPMIGIFFLLILSITFFYFIEPLSTPYIRVLGLYIHMLYISITVGTILAIIKITKRKEKIVFLKQFLVLFIVLFICSFINLLLGNIGYGGFLVILQTVLVPYLLYFIFVGFIDSKERLNTMIKLVFIIMILAFSIQLIELTRGEKFDFGLSNDFINENFKVPGTDDNYVPIRSHSYTFLALFLSVGLFLERKDKKHIVLGIIAALAFILSLTRQWLVYIAFGVFVIILLDKKLSDIKKLFSLFITFLVIFLILSVLISTFTTYPLGNVLKERYLTLLNPSGEGTYMDRVDRRDVQWDIIKTSPLIGSTNYLDNDVHTGYVNILTLFGIFGLIAVLYLFFAVFFRTLYLKKILLKGSLERGYILGILGVLAGILFATFFWWEFFMKTREISMIMVTMAIVDRIYFFNKK